MQTRLTKKEIEELIPHREPIFFLHEVLVTGPNEGNSIACWEENHPIFQGHFPDFSIVPGIYLIEAAAQLASVISTYTLKEKIKNHDPEFMGKKSDDFVGVLTGIRRSLIHKPVFPNQEVSMKIKLTRAFDKAMLGTGNGYIGDQKICSYELMFAVAMKDDLENFKKRL